MKSKAEYQKARRSKLAAAGLCNCGKEKPAGKSVCSSCVEQIKRNRNKRTLKRKADGLCVDCGGASAENKTRCAMCRARHAKYGHKLRDTALEMYGKVCSCCREDIKVFLAIDHINDDGYEHRKTISTNICSWLKVNDWPNGYRVLCHNCNHGRYLNGGVCPHEENRPYATQGVILEQPSEQKFRL